MSQTAPKTFSVTRQAADPRADGGQRVIHISETGVVIDRVLDGMRMRVAVPVSAYGDLALDVRLDSAQATLRLCHCDADLEVVLAIGDGVEVARRAKAWAEALGKRVRIAEACVTIGTPIPRRKTRVKSTRRSSFSRRRKMGFASGVSKCFAGEREIIARS